jgi:hypothetical protein
MPLCATSAVAPQENAIAFLTTKGKILPTKRQGTVWGAPCVLGEVPEDGEGAVGFANDGRILVAAGMRDSAGLWPWGTEFGKVAILTFNGG